MIICFPFSIDRKVEKEYNYPVKSNNFFSKGYDGKESKIWNST